MNLPPPSDHHFHLAQKVDSIRPVASIDWDELEQPHFVSELDKHLYAIYADDCARKGNSQEGIHTLQALVKSSPDYVAGWLQLTTVLIETGQQHEALYTIRDLMTLHPWYQKGHRVFKQLLKKCPKPELCRLTFYPQSTSILKPTHQETFPPLQTENSRSPKFSSTASTR